MASEQIMLIVVSVLNGTTINKKTRIDQELLCSPTEAARI